MKRRREQEIDVNREFHKIALPNISRSDKMKLKENFGKLSSNDKLNHVKAFKHTDPSRRAVRRFVRRLGGNLYASGSGSMKTNNELIGALSGSRDWTDNLMEQAVVKSILDIELDKAKDDTTTFLRVSGLGTAAVQDFRRSEYQQNPEMFEKYRGDYKKELNELEVPDHIQGKFSQVLNTTDKPRQVMQNMMFVCLGARNSEIKDQLAKAEKGSDNHKYLEKLYQDSNFESTKMMDCNKVLISKHKSEAQFGAMTTMGKGRNKVVTPEDVIAHGQLLQDKYNKMTGDMNDRRIINETKDVVYGKKDADGNRTGGGYDETYNNYLAKQEQIAQQKLESRSTGQKFADAFKDGVSTMWKGVKSIFKTQPMDTGRHVEISE